MNSIQTEFGGCKRLCRVACQDGETTCIWTSGDGDTMILYDLNGTELKRIRAKQGHWPGDIAVAMNGDLVFTDKTDKSVTLWSQSTGERTEINLEQWTPRGVCSTLYLGDFLVIMDNDNHQTKIAGYTNTKETFVINFNDETHPIASFGPTKYIAEHKSENICVACLEARLVVVINQAGEVLFTYNGNPEKPEEPFYPHGITTDSKNNILIADSQNCWIHRLGQDGKFHRLIIDNELRRPRGLCVDLRDNLFVANSITGKVMKIISK